jgi:hypothetical protein
MRSQRVFLLAEAEHFKHVLQANTLRCWGPAAWRYRRWSRGAGLDFGQQWTCDV